MRAVESDSVKSVKVSCTRPVKETREQTLHRQEQNRMHMASMRESETLEQSVHRQEQNNAYSDQF